MAVSPKIIYLEADEEVTSVVDKLRKTEFKKVVLVVPKEASLLQGVVNLKLIKRQAQILEKSIAIVTHDKVGRALAEKIGILASAKLEDVVNEAEFIPVPLETIDGEDKTEPLSETSDSSPLAETNEVIFKDKPTVKDRRGKVDDEPEELVVKEEPLVDEKTDDFTKKEIETESDNLMPSLPKKKIFAVVGAILLILLSAAYIYIPRAKAEIMVKAERKPVSIDFSGEKDAKLDAEKAIIPVQAIEVEKESNKKFPATGKKDAGQKAVGKLTISTTGSATALVQGTRFNPAGSDLIYKSDKAIEVPKFPATTEVTVTADQPGEKYNGFGDKGFVVTAYGSSSGFVVLSSAAGMSGGTTKEVTYVTQGDINAAKDELTKDAIEEATSDFNKQANEVKIIDNSKKEEVLSATANPAVNGEASEFSMTVKVKLRALGYNLNDVSSLIKSEVERQLGSTKEVVDDGAEAATVTIDDMDLDSSKISGTIKTDAYASEKFDKDKLKTELAGLNSTKADEYIKGLEGVKEVEFQFFPSFLKSFPRLKNHIFINISVADKENL